MMENSISLKKHEIAERLAHHPAGAILGGLSSAVLCGILGSAHGNTVAAVMAALGAMIGTPLGAMLAGSSQQE